MLDSNKQNFNHLKIHTQYSICEGAIKIENLKDILNKKDITDDYVECEFLGNTMNKNDHKQAVLKIKEDIKNGLIFQCEVGFKSYYNIKGNT